MGTLIGLDIGTTGVRAVEVSTAGRTMTVRHAHCVPLAPGVIDDGRLRDPSMLTSALRQLWRRGRFTDKHVHLSVGWHPQVLVRPIEVPWMADRTDMKGMVEAKAAKDMPVDIATLYLDHHVTNVHERMHEDGERVPTADVALVGVSRALVDGLLEAVGDADLVPMSVDITTFALTRLVALAGSGPGKVDLVIHLGASTGMIVGVVDGQPVFTQPLKEFAGQDLTEQIASALTLPTDKAESLKVAGPSPAQAALGIAPDPTPIVAAWTTALVSACCDAVNYVTVQLGKPVGRVWLAGGGSRLPTLAARIGAEIGSGTQVTLIEPGTWVQHPERLASSTGPRQDMTVALATTMR